MNDDAIAIRDRLLREAIAWDDSLCDSAEDLEIQPEWKRAARELLGMPAAPLPICCPTPEKNPRAPSSKSPR